MNGAAGIRKSEQEDGSESDKSDAQKGTCPEKEDVGNFEDFLLIPRKDGR